MELIKRLRSYAPLGDGSLWSQSSKDIQLSADEIESMRKQVAEQKAELAQYRSIDIYKELSELARQRDEAMKDEERLDYLMSLINERVAGTNAPLWTRDAIDAAIQGERNDYA